MIESKSNSKIKLLRELSTKKGRRENDMYVIEGLHMVGEAIKYGVDLCEIFVASSAELTVMPVVEGAMCDITVVADAAFKFACNTENSQGVMAVVRMPKEEPFYGGDKFLVLDHIQDPGNMGTIIRSAAATGFCEIILLDCVDPFNPKAVRSSSSGVYFVKLHNMTTDDVLELAASHDIFAASAEGENVFEKTDIPPRFGLVIGNEANGVSRELREKCKMLALPMDKRIESLNAAVSASVLMYVLKNR